jgi:RND family efflux transporter MFP subunit
MKVPGFHGGYSRLWIPRASAGAAAIVLSALIASGCGEKPPGPSRGPSGPPVAVEAATAEQSLAASSQEFTASLNPIRRATPGTVLMGRVDSIRRREGDRVRSGEVLARVESRDVSARLAQAEAGLAAARAMERNAALMKERMERLLAKQAATQKNVDDAVAGYETATANVHAAEEGVAAAKVYVGYSDITAPFDGVVTERHIEAGDTAAPGMPLFVVEDTSRMKVEAQIAESTAHGLRSGSPVAVEVESAGLGTVRGTIDEVLPAADPRSRTFTVRILLDNREGSLRSGMFARIRLPGAETQTVSVPMKAVVRRGPLSGIYVIDGESVARLRWVTLGSDHDGRTEVLTGLGPGERYVVDPQPELADGRRVEVR